jgi:hypothetical protein
VSLDALAAWRELLGNLGKLGDALRVAIEGDDLIAAIAAMMQLRSTRAALARVESPLAIAGELAELELIADVARLLVGARSAEAMMARWLQRALPADDQLLATPLGIAVLADSLLPAVWDFEADLVVLVGPELTPVVELLADLGQRRIVQIHGESPRAISVHAIAELAPAVRTLVPGPPNQFVVRALAPTLPGFVEEAVETVQTALQDLRIHRNTVRAFSRTWLDHGLANLPALARYPSIADVGDAFAGVPMVIVAPGPSLAKNVGQLQALRGRAIIAAFSHSLKPVLAAGVTPDLVITVDPQDVRYHFAGCDVSQTCIVNAATVHPSLFDLPAPRFMTLSANSAIDDWLFDAVGHEALVPGGGSVATSAFSLALRWKCDPILFVGLDLSFPGGAYYVSTSSDGNARANVDANGVMRVEGWSSDFEAMKASGGPAASAERGVELPGWNGGTVPSSFMFALFHRWFVERMKGVTSTTVFNCTEGGAFIEGMQHVPLAEVPLGAAKVDVSAVLQRTQESLDRGRSLRMIDHFEVFTADLRRARKLGALARREIARQRTGPSLARLEHALARTLEPLAFASLLAQREVERANDVARRAGSEGDYLAASTALMTTLEDVIAQLEPALETAVVQLRKIA